MRLICGADQAARRPLLAVGVVALLCGLAGCGGAIDAYRSMRGLSKDDPNPATTPFARNLAAGASGEYPNLASVPPPPTRELSTAEREKLTQDLIANRTSIERRDAELRAAHAAPPLPPPANAGIAAAKTAAAAPESSEPNSGLRKRGEPPAPQSLEASLVSPQVREVPMPEQPRPAPPPPHLAPAAAPPKEPPPAPLPAAMASPPPSPPPAIQPPPAPPVIAKGATPAAPAKPLAEIRFAAGATALGPADRAALGRLAAAWRQHPEKLRIVGYAAVAGGAEEQLNSFHAALEHAQAVAAALTNAGVPRDRIHVEAAPAAAGATGDRAVVLPVP